MADEVESFAIGDEVVIEVRIARVTTPVRTEATVEIALTRDGERAVVVVLGPDGRRSSATEVCGMSDHDQLVDFARILIDLPSDLDAFRASAPVNAGGSSRKERKRAQAEYDRAVDDWMRDFANGPHRAVVDRVDQNTVAITVDADLDGKPEREWTVDLGWSLGDEEFRRECEEELKLD